MWAAQPPLALGWLGWLAPVPWLALVRRKYSPAAGLIASLWFAAFVFWMAALHWLRLPHPAVYLGWFALSAYLAIYLPLFVGLSRVAVHQLEDPALARGPGRLDRPRTGAGPRDDRLHDGFARPHAVPLADRDPDRRLGGRIRRRLRDDPRRRGDYRFRISDCGLRIEAMGVPLGCWRLCSLPESHWRRSSPTATRSSVRLDQSAIRNPQSAFHPHRPHPRQQPRRSGKPTPRSSGRS